MPAMEIGDKYDNAGDKVIRPSKLAHVVIRTTEENFKPMVEFYKTFLNGTASYENDFISFITYDEEHHRIGIVKVPGTMPKAPNTAGMLHFAFTFDSLEDLALSYRQRKAYDISPVWCVNHGITMSMYYADPDGNQIETQVDAFETTEEAIAYMETHGFADNPIGVNYDPEELIERLRSGEDHKKIFKRPTTGARGVPNAARD